MLNKLSPFPLICFYICKRFPTLQVISVDHVFFCAGFGLIHGYQCLYGMKLLLRPKLRWRFLCQFLGFFMLWGFMANSFIHFELFLIDDRMSWQFAGEWPHRFIYFNAWPSVVGTGLECLGGMDLMEEVCPWGWAQWFQTPVPFPVSSVLPVSVPPSLTISS